jgi:hypothetical protein
MHHLHFPIGRSWRKVVVRIMSGYGMNWLMGDEEKNYPTATWQTKLG